MEIAEAIRTLTGHPDPSIRRLAADELALKKIYTIESVNALIRGLSDDDKGINDVCFWSLLSVADELKDFTAASLANFINSANIELRNTVGDLLVRLGADSASHISPWLADTDTTIRQFACDLLGRIGSDKVLPELYTLLDDPDAGIISSAIEAIGNIGFPGSFKFLADLYDTNEDIKPALIEAIGKLGTGESDFFLLNILSVEEDIFSKIVIIDAIGLRSRDLEISRKFLADLETAPEELQPSLLKSIFAIAYRVGETISLPDKFRELARNALTDEDPDMRTAGLLALGSLYHEEEIDALVVEACSGNDEILQYITFNILAHNTAHITGKFISGFLASMHSNLKLLDLISLVTSIREFALPENTGLIISSITDYMLENPGKYIEEAGALLLALDRDLFIGHMRSLLHKDGHAQINLILDLIAALRIRELIPDIKSIAERDDYNAPRCAKIIDVITK